MKGPINDHSAIIVSMGLAIGMMISLYISKFEQPSILAASSSSVETESMYPFSIKVLDAMAGPAYISMSIICLLKAGMTDDTIECMVKNAVIPANVGMV